MSSPDSDPVDEGLVATRRVLILAGTAVVAVLVAVGLYLSGARGDVGGDTVDVGAAASTAIGPAPGTDVDSYVAQRRAALAAAGDEADGLRVAVVSFTDYVTVDDVDALVGSFGGDGDDDGDADDDGDGDGDGGAVFMGPVLLAPVGSEPSLTTDVDAALDAIRAEAEVQLEELESIAPTVDDPEFADFYAAEIVRYRALLDAVGRDDNVFGFVVSAPFDVLVAIADRSDVRLVDVGTGGALQSGTTLRGLRPEELAVAGTPPTRP